MASRTTQSDCDDSLENVLKLVSSNGNALKAFQIVAHNTNDMKNNISQISDSVQMIMRQIYKEHQFTCSIKGVSGLKRSRDNINEQNTLKLEKNILNRVVILLKIIQTLLKTYTSVLNTQAQNIDDTDEAMDLVVFCLSIVIQYEDKLQLKDLVLENMMYQLAKKYMNNIKKSGNKAHGILICLQIRLWDVYLKLNPLENIHHKNKMKDLLHQLNFRLKAISYRNISTLPPPEGCSSIPLIRLVISFTSSCLILEQSVAECIKIGSTATLPWIKHLCTLPGVSEDQINSHYDHLFRLLWRRASSMNFQDNENQKLKLQYLALDTMIQCKTYSVVNVVQQAFRVGIQFERNMIPTNRRVSESKECDKRNMKMLEEFYVSILELVHNESREQIAKSLMHEYVLWLEHFISVCDWTSNSYLKISIAEHLVQYIMLFKGIASYLLPATTLMLSATILKVNQSELVESIQRKYGTLHIALKTRMPLCHVIASQISSADKEKSMECSVLKYKHAKLKVSVAVLKKISQVKIEMKNLNSTVQELLPFILRWSKKSATECFNFLITDHPPKLIRRIAELRNVMIFCVSEICKGLIDSLNPPQTKTILDDKWSILKVVMRLYRICVVSEARGGLQNESNIQKYFQSMEFFLQHLSLTKSQADNNCMVSLIESISNDLQATLREIYSSCLHNYKKEQWGVVHTNLTPVYNFAQSILEHLSCNLQYDGNPVVKKFVISAYKNWKLQSITSLLGFCFREEQEHLNAMELFRCAIIYNSLSSNASVLHQALDNYLAMILLLIKNGDLSTELDISSENSEIRILCHKLQQVCDLLCCKSLPVLQAVRQSIRVEFRECQQITIKYHNTNTSNAIITTNTTIMSVLQIWENYILSQILKKNQQKPPEYIAMCRQLGDALLKRHQGYIQLFTSDDYSACINLISSAHSLMSNTVESIRKLLSSDISNEYTTDYYCTLAWLGIMDIELILLGNYNSSVVGSPIRADIACAKKNLEECINSWEKNIPQSSIVYDDQLLPHTAQVICSIVTVLEDPRLQWLAQNILCKVISKYQTDSVPTVGFYDFPPLLTHLTMVIDAFEQSICPDSILKDETPSSAMLGDILPLADANLVGWRKEQLKGEDASSQKQLLQALKHFAIMKGSYNKIESLHFNPRHYGITPIDIYKAIGLRESLVYYAVSVECLRAENYAYALQLAKSALAICWKLAKNVTFCLPTSESRHNKSGIEAIDNMEEISEQQSYTATRKHYQLQETLTSYSASKTNVHSIIYFQACYSMFLDVLVLSKLLLCHIAKIYSLLGKPERSFVYYVEVVELVSGLGIPLFEYFPIIDFAHFQLDCNDLKKSREILKLMESFPLLSSTKLIMDDMPYVHQIYLCQLYMLKGRLLSLEVGNEFEACNLLEQGVSIVSKYVSQQKGGLISPLFLQHYISCLRIITSVKLTILESQHSKIQNFNSDKCLQEQLICSMHNLYSALLINLKLPSLEKSLGLSMLCKANIYLIRKNCTSIWSLDATFRMLEEAYIIGKILSNADAIQQARLQLGMLYFQRHISDMPHTSSEVCFDAWASSFFLVNNGLLKQNVAKTQMQNITLQDIIENFSELMQRMYEKNEGQIDIKNEVHQHISQIESIPSNLCVVAITVASKSEILITQFTGRNAPLIFNIFIPIDFYLNSMENILLASAECLATANCEPPIEFREAQLGVSPKATLKMTSQDKKAWWATRRALDEQIHTVVQDLERKLGFWRSLLCKSRYAPEHPTIIKCLQLLTGVQSPLIWTKYNTNLATSLLCSLAGTIDILSPEELVAGLTCVAAILANTKNYNLAEGERTLSADIIEKLLACIKDGDKLIGKTSNCTICNYIGDLSEQDLQKKKVAELKGMLSLHGLPTVGQKKVLVSRFIRAHNKNNKKNNESEVVNLHLHSILILDDQVQQFPWEALDILSYKSVSRMPSLELLLCTLSLHNSARQVYCNSNLLAHQKKVAFVLNPAGDLKATQLSLLPLLEHGRSLLNWKGIVGAPPMLEDIEKYLAQPDIYIFCGHGSGEKYFHRDDVLTKAAPRCSTSLLFGCSSGRIQSQGKFGVKGAVLSYLRAGAPAVLGMLWDVTDKDIDLLSLNVLNNWLVPTQDEAEYIGAESLSQVLSSSRDKCKLKFLNGFSAICYGLPLYVQTNNV